MVSFNYNYQHSQQIFFYIQILNPLAETIATYCVTKARAQSILLVVVNYINEQISHWFILFQVCYLHSIISSYQSTSPIVID